MWPLLIDRLTIQYPLTTALQTVTVLFTQRQFQLLWKAMSHAAITAQILTYLNTNRRDLPSIHSHAPMNLCNAEQTKLAKVHKRSKMNPELVNWEFHPQSNYPTAHHSINWEFKAQNIISPHTTVLTESLMLKTLPHHTPQYRLRV